MHLLKAVGLPLYALREYDMNLSGVTCRNFKVVTLKVNMLVPTVCGHFLAYCGDHNDVNRRSFGAIETGRVIHPVPSAAIINATCAYRSCRH